MTIGREEFKNKLTELSTELFGDEKINGRKTEYVAFRKSISSYLYFKCGFTQSTIARAIGRDASTVNSYINNYSADQYNDNLVSVYRTAIEAKFEGLLITSIT